MAINFMFFLLYLCIKNIFKIKISYDSLFPVPNQDFNLKLCSDLYYAAEVMISIHALELK